MTCEHADVVLDAYVDRELEAESADAVRDHLQECATCRRRVADRQMLGWIVRATPYYPAPVQLRTRVAARIGRRASHSRVVTWATAAAFALSVVGGITLLRSGVMPRSDAVIEDVVTSHVRSLMAEHLFDVRSSDQHTVKPWFVGKLDFAPPVVDLSSIGFPLAGGRLDYVGGRPLAALIYQRAKHTINVFISPQPSTAPGSIEARSVRGFHVRHWSRDGMSFWAVSDLNDGELTQFARALQGS